jgi:squalene synthase HpnC
VSEASGGLELTEQERRPRMAEWQGRSVRDLLDAWGPETASRNPVRAAEAEGYCRHLARTHYENFPIVSWLLPRTLHQHFFNVYAFCRWADDLGDEMGDRSRSLELLAWWRDELAACYGGSPCHPVFLALRPTIDRFAIPAQPFEDLISAFEQDQRVTDYETFDQLRDYCRRSADPVGRLVLYLCEAHTPQNVEWSDSVCTGLQLANFWQDVARDLDIGRIYLPREDRQRCGYDDDALRSRTTNNAFLRLMELEVGRARQFLCDGVPLVERMPGRLQIDIELFIRGGLQVLREIERIGYRVWDTRPVVSKGRFARLFLGCTGRALVRRLRRQRSD